MRTAERLVTLQEWTYNACCKGRKMKTPPPNQDITKYLDKREPSIFLNFMPMRAEQDRSIAGVNPPSVAPSITLLLDNSMGKYMRTRGLIPTTRSTGKRYSASSLTSRRFSPCMRMACGNPASLTGLRPTPRTLICHSYARERGKDCSRS